MPRRDRIAKETTGYTDAEGRALVAPLVGMAAEEMHGYIIVGIDKEGRCGLAGPGNISDGMSLAILEGLARHMRALGVTPGP